MSRPVALSTFKSDGCSGNISNGWSTTVGKLSKIFSSFENQYKDAQNIPFEEACVIHDQSYHAGDGGYVARLKADNALRKAIIDYGMSHTEEIKERTGLSADESAIYMYEVVAESVYRGVRLGGAPCTGTTYAWGFGYNNGSCI